MVINGIFIKIHSFSVSRYLAECKILVAADLLVEALL